MPRKRVRPKAEDRGDRQGARLIRRAGACWQALLADLWPFSGQATRAAAMLWFGVSPLPPAVFHAVDVPGQGYLVDEPGLAGTTARTRHMPRSPLMASGAAQDWVICLLRRDNPSECLPARNRQGGDHWRRSEGEVWSLSVIRFVASEGASACAADASSFNGVSHRGRPVGFKLACDCLADEGAIARPGAGRRVADSHVGVLGNGQEDAGERSAF